jgi:hypothetical protein
MTSLVGQTVLVTGANRLPVVLVHPNACFDEWLRDPR